MQPGTDWPTYYPQRVTENIKSELPFRDVFPSLLNCSDQYPTLRVSRLGRLGRKGLLVCSGRENIPIFFFFFVCIVKLVSERVCQGVFSRGSRQHCWNLFPLEWIIQDRAGFIQCSTACPQNGESWHVVWKGHLKPIGGWQLLIFITCLRSFTWRYSLKLVSWQIKLIKFLLLSVRHFFFPFLFLLRIYAVHHVFAELFGSERKLY